MCGFALNIAFSFACVTAAADPLPPGAVLRLGETRFRTNGEIRHLSFSPDGAILHGWVLGFDARLLPVAWDTTTGVSLSPGVQHVPVEGPEGTTLACRLSGERVLTAGPGSAARVWDASSGRQLALLAGHSAQVTAVAVSKNGQRIATGSADGLIKLWDAETFHPVSVLGGHTGAVRTIRAAASGKRAVTVGEDQSVRVWDLQNGKELRGFKATGPVELTSDGTAVVMSVGKTAIVRDVLTGLEIVPATQPSPPTPTFSELLGRLGISLSFSPDGRMVAVGHRDGTIGLYESATGQCRRMLVGHRSQCRALTFTPDGSKLLSAGTDHIALVWAVRVQDLPMTETIKQEKRAGKLWTMLTTGPADASYQAMARFAAEPSAAVKMASMRLKAAQSAGSLMGNELADRRGIELLESLGTTEAREFLEELAKGEPTAHLTREARRALERPSGKKYTTR